MSTADILTELGDLGNLKMPFACLVMNEPLQLTLGQEFELEQMTRLIDATGDPQDLRTVCKKLLLAWHTQKAVTEWMMRQTLPSPIQIPQDSS